MLLWSRSTKPRTSMSCAVAGVMPAFRQSVPDARQNRNIRPGKLSLPAMSLGVGFLVALLAIASVADGSPHGEVTFREGLPAGPQREGLGSGRRGPAFEKIQSAILVPPSDCGL